VFTNIDMQWLQYIDIWLLVHSDELWLLLKKVRVHIWIFQLFANDKIYFIYECNVIEQAANTMNRTVYKMKWDCLTHR